MKKIYKVTLTSILLLLPALLISQSCDKENNTNGITSKMRERAADFKRVIETERSGYRSGTYVYRSRMTKYLDNPQLLIDKLVMLGFTDVYISFDKPGSYPCFDAAWHKAFNRLAHNNKMKVHALMLDNLSLYVSDQPIADDLDQINSFNDSAEPLERFDGISADLEAHILKINSDRRPPGLTLSWQENYEKGGDNDLLMKRTIDVMALAKRDMGNLTLSQALGFFVQPRVNSGHLEWGGADQFLKYCDNVIVMAYNYKATRVVEMATPLLFAAEGYPRSVSVAVKTSLNTLGEDGPLTSFQPQGWENLITSLEYIVKECKKFSTFRGIDVFEFAGLEIMLGSE